MTIKLVSDGQEPMIREAVAWLERRGIVASEIQSVTVTATVGEPMILTVKLIVSDPDEVPAAEPELSEWHMLREKGSADDAQLPAGMRWTDPKLIDVWMPGGDK